MEIKTLPHGQVVLPLEICRRLGIEAGTRLEVEIEEKTGCIRLRPVRHAFGSHSGFRQRAKPKQKPQSKRGK